METTKMRVITLKELWDLLVERFMIMVLVAILACGGTFLLTKLTVEPQYSSTAILYILRQSSDASSSDVSNDFSLALKIVKDCTYLLKSHAVVDEVIGTLNLDMTYDELRGRISASNPENTRILEITVEADTPQQAKTIVDAFCAIAPTKINEAMGYDQVNMYELGTLNDEPCNTMGLMTYFLIGIAAAALTYVVFLVVLLLDDRIRTDEDIERYLGLSILGDIPNADDPKRDRYGYGSYGKRGQKKGGTGK